MSFGDGGVGILIEVGLRISMGGGTNLTGGESEAGIDGVRLLISDLGRSKLYCLNGLRPITWWCGGSVGGVT